MDICMPKFPECPKILWALWSYRTMKMLFTKQNIPQWEKSKFLLQIASIPTGEHFSFILLDLRFVSVYWQRSQYLLLQWHHRRGTWKSAKKARQRKGPAVLHPKTTGLSVINTPLSGAQQVCHKQDLFSWPFANAMLLSSGEIEVLPTPGVQAERAQCAQPQTCPCVNYTQTLCETGLFIPKI